MYDPTNGNTTRYETVIPRSAAFSNSASEKPSKPWISGEESDGEIAEILPPRESVFDPENPDNNNLRTAPSIDEDEVYVDTVKQVPPFPV